MACATDAIAFANGCGGRGTLALASGTTSVSKINDTIASAAAARVSRAALVARREERNVAGRMSLEKFVSEGHNLTLVRALVQRAQRELEANTSLVERLRRLLPPERGSCARKCYERRVRHAAWAVVALCGSG